MDACFIELVKNLVKLKKLLNGKIEYSYTVAGKDGWLSIATLSLNDDTQVLFCGLDDKWYYLFGVFN